MGRLAELRLLGLALVAGLTLISWLTLLVLLAVLLPPVVFRLVRVAGLLVVIQDVPQYL